jgi:hypothetical protein
MKKQKLTITDPEFIAKARDILTKPVYSEVYIITDKNGFKSREIKTKYNEPKIRDLKKLGYKVEILRRVRRTHIHEIAEIPVDIAPIKRSYMSGIRITVNLEGKTDAQINADYKFKLHTITSFLNRNGIPVNKVCQESFLGCDGDY